MLEFTGEEQKEFLSGRIIPVEDKTAKKGKRSIKETAPDTDMIEVPPDDILFQKQYYGISEVAQMFHVNISLLRYWEGEFALELRKNRKGDRFFKPADVKTVALIHDLLRRRKFTIEGAKALLKVGDKIEEKHAMIQSLQTLRSFLLEIKAHL